MEYDIANEEAARDEIRFCDTHNGVTYDELIQQLELPFEENIEGRLKYVSIENYEYN